MQAIILAAGLGQRLGLHTREQTKAMVPVHGTPLIAHALSALRAAGVTRVNIVTGHGAAALTRFVSSSFNDMQISYTHNEVYAETNNIYSLWLARDLLREDDTLLLESDIIFDPRILRDVIANPRENLAVVAPFEPWMDGTVTVLDADDRIVSMVPKELFDWGATQSYFKTVNIYKFSKGFSSRLYLPFLDACITAFGRNRFYEQVLTAITQLSKTELAAHRLRDEKWYEIDDVQDLDIAETLFCDPSAALARMQKRYGGYWRFPRIKDFCYLVNPHFPPPRLMKELSVNLGSLVGAYPSGHAQQSLLAAKAFACEPHEIVVGNGAAELIAALMPELRGPIVLPSPTFEEFARAVPGDRLRRLPAKDRGFTREVAELVDSAGGAGALVLVNPDNPSGQYLSHHQVIALCAALAQRDTRLVVDESFLDFAGDPERGVLRSEILQRFANLVVLKSVSKSYGVAGLRLGVLASADAALLARVKARLPVWNINSVAEGFLQIVGKYTRDYALACASVADDRDALQAQLQAIGFLRVVPSRANFILCELVSTFTAAELALRLLDEHQILIKDCSGKAGFAVGEYVRFAVRDSADNARLITALRQLARAAG